MTNKVYSFLGLAMKAGKIISGEESCERAIKSLKAELVIVAEDASDNTKKRFTDLCAHREAQMKVFGNKELLGRYTGKELRAVLVITDREFSKRLIQMLNEIDQVYGGESIGES